MNINIAKDKAAMETHNNFTVSAIGLFDTVAAVGEELFNSAPTVYRQEQSHI